MVTRNNSESAEPTGNRFGGGDRGSLEAGSFCVIAYEIEPGAGRMHLRGEAEGWTGLSGDPAADLCWSDWLDMIDPNDRIAVQRTMIAARREGRSYECVYHVRRDDGTVAQVVDRGAALPAETGRERLLVGVIADVSAADGDESRSLLHSSWERFRRLSEGSPVGIFQYDTDANCVYVNDRWREITGVAVTHGTGGGWMPLVHPDDAVVVRREWLTFLGVPVDDFVRELRLARTDGCVRWVQARCRAMHDGGGSVIGYVGTLEDITERRLARHRLEASERRFATVFRASPIALVVVSVETGILLDANPAACRMAGLDQSRLVGRDAADFAPHASADERRVFIEQVLLSGGSGHAEQSLVTAGGASLTVLCSYDLIEIDGRKCMLVALQDTTARKRAEQVLRENERRFRSLVENSTALVAEITLEGTVCYASPNHVDVLGYEPDELAGCSILGLLHPADRPEFIKRLQSDEDAGRYRFRHKDGQWRWVEASGHVFREANEEERAVIVARDVTDVVRAEEARRSLEAQLRQAQKLEAIGTLAGGIAHDFNNILTALFGNLQFIQRLLPEGHQGLDHVQEALQASARARELVSQILTFTRRQDQQRRAIGLGGLVKEALKLLRSSMPTSIAIETEIDPDCPAVLCDATQIHQVIMNLGTNAGHAMRDRKDARLHVSLRRVRLDSGTLARYPQLRAEHEVRLSIRDTGCGMKPAVLERIFEPFFTTKGPNEGTGLGLAVVHGIVVEHGGGIVVRSTPGSGSEFSLYFPPHAVDEAEEEAAGAPLAQGSGQRVILVDDEVPIVRLGAAMLKTLGYEPVVFTEPQEAFRAFEKDPSAYDVLLSDLTMPGMSGIVLADRMRLLQPDLPVVIASGYAGQVEVEAVERLGAAVFLAKPFGLDALADRLGQLLRR